MVRQTCLLQQTPEQEPRATQQYQRFLEAADRLGPHLEGLFRKGFVQIFSSTQNVVTEIGVHREPAVDPGALVPPEHPKRADTLPGTPESEAIDVSIIVRLHFVEAMMVLLFNALDQKQQSSIEQGFGTLSSKLENLEILGLPPEALRAYRDALSAVQKMLASNPEPGEISVALGGDFAKRFRNT
jgi:hypothetical protein